MKGCSNHYCKKSSTCKLYILPFAKQRKWNKDLEMCEDYQEITTEWRHDGTSSEEIFDSSIKVAYDR